MDEFELADQYLEAGDGEKAMSILLRLAVHGRVAAMHAIGHTYLYGIAGMPRDYDEAFKWFTTAASRGCPQGMYHLGMCNAKGYGTPVNPRKALEWYQKSAANDDEDAMFEIGNCYRDGFGVPADKTKAEEWYARALSRGQKQAGECLEKLKGGD